MIEKNVLELLPKMSPSQLREVAARAKALCAGTDDARLSSDIQDVYDAMSIVFAKRGTKMMPLNVFLKTTNGRKLREYAPDTIAYVRDAFNNKQRLAVKNALILLVGMLYRQLRVERSTVTPGMLSRDLNRIPECVENQFPGYMDCGMLPFVLQRHVQKMTA